MATGNTFGLGEISHFGAFQRVGGKAGGFINKKFFHPSNLRNQEKLWQAMTADERERKKEGELAKRREEERQVEELRKQMYLSGQGKASDIALALAAKDLADSALLGDTQKTDMKLALDQQKKRKLMLKKALRAREAAAAVASGGQAPEGSPEGSPGASSGEEDEDDIPAAAGMGGEHEDRVLARSRYEEDVHVRGHRSVWGSWYAEAEKQWGFACCKIRNFSEQCPLEPLPEEEVPASEREPRKKKRRKGDEKEEEEEAAPQGGLQGRAAASSTAAATDPATGERSLIDTRMVEAAARRKEEKRQQEEKKKEEIKKSGYLADLLGSPTEQLDG